MAQITINGVVKTVEDDVAKYVGDLETEVKNALGEASAAKALVPDLEQRIKQAVADGEAKVKAAETKLIGWVEARAHSFFLSMEGDFKSVKGFLQHLTSGLEPHMQPQTLTSTPAAQAAQTAAVEQAPAPQASAAPAPAAPASPAADAAAPSAAPQGSQQQ